jgi:hypothetical protein
VSDFHLSNIFSYFLVLYFICYMFRSYDHLQAEIYTSEIKTTDKGFHPTSY